MNEQHNSPDQRPASDYGAHDFLQLGAELGKGSHQDGGPGGQPRPSEAEGSWLLGESPDQGSPVVRQEVEQECSGASEGEETPVSGGWLMDGDAERSSLQPAPTASTPRRFEGTYIEPENSREAFGRSLHAAILPGAGVVLVTVALIGGWQLMKSSGNNAGGGGSERIEFKPPQRQEILVRPNVESVRPVAGDVGPTTPAPAARIPARTHAEPGELSIWPSDMADDLVEPFELSEGPLAPEEAEAILNDIEGLLVDAAETAPDSNPAEYIDPLFNEQLPGAGSPPPAHLAMPVLISGWSRSLMGVPVADAVALFEPTEMVEDPGYAQDVEVLDEPAFDAVALEEPVEAEVDELDAWLEHEGVVPFVAMGVPAEQPEARSPEVMEFSSEDSVAMLSVSPWQDGFWAEFDEVERSREDPFQDSHEPEVSSQPVTDRVVLVPVVDPQGEVALGGHSPEGPESQSPASPQTIDPDVETLAEVHVQGDPGSEVVLAEEPSTIEPVSGEQIADSDAVVELTEEVGPDEVVVEDVGLPAVESIEPLSEPDWSDEAVVDGEGSEVSEPELQESVVASVEEVPVDTAPDGVTAPSVEGLVDPVALEDPITEVSEQPTDIGEKFAQSEFAEEVAPETAVEAFEEPWEQVALSEEILDVETVEEPFEPDWNPERSSIAGLDEDSEVKQDSQVEKTVETVDPATEPGGEWSEEASVASEEVTEKQEQITEANPYGGAAGEEKVAELEAQENPDFEPTVDAFDETWDEAWGGDLTPEESGDPVAEVHEFPADSIEAVEDPGAALEPTVEVFDESYEAVAAASETEESEAIEPSPVPERNDRWTEDLPAPDYQDEVAGAQPADPAATDPVVDFSEEPVDGQVDEPSVHQADEPSEPVAIAEEIVVPELEPALQDTSGSQESAESDWITAIDEDPTSEGRVWTSDQPEADAEVFVVEAPVDQEPWNEAPVEEVLSVDVIALEPEPIEVEVFEVQDPGAEQRSVAEMDEPGFVLEVPGLEPGASEGEGDEVADSIQDSELGEEPEIEVATELSPAVAEALDALPDEGSADGEPTVEEPSFDEELTAEQRPQSNLLDGGSLLGRYGSFIRTGRVPQSASVEGAEALAAAEEAAEAAADPEQVDISEYLPKRKGLARVDVEKRWDSVEVSDELLASKVRLFTPFVGDVRVAVAGGGLVEGELHAVGSGSVWVDTRAGRLQLELERVERIDRMGTQGKLLGEDPDERDYTTLPRIRVRTAGGIFVGHEISREGDSVTLFTDEGLKITLKGAEVMPAQQRRSVLGMRPRQR